MRDRLSDSDPNKWLYRLHTGAKHRLLEEYLKGWLPILTRGGQRRGTLVRLLLVDGFAGRGRYIGGEAGSPLILVRVASEFVKWGLEQRNPLRAEIQIAFIEHDLRNYKALVSEINAAQADPDKRPEVILHPPIQGEFANAIHSMLNEARKENTPMFVFADPFGFAGIPLSAMRNIVAVRRTEVFITFMVREANRFLTTTDRDKAFTDLFGLQSDQLAAFRERVKDALDREAQLRDLYINRLKAGANAQFVWPFRVFPANGGSTIYYMIHASRHIRAFRLMKDITKKQGAHGEFTFYGKNDFARQAQLPLFGPNTSELKQHMLEKFAGQEITFNDLCDHLYPDPACYFFTEPDFRQAGKELRKEGHIRVVPVTSKTKRGLNGKDLLIFPAAVEKALL